ncbi:STAS domain-containing protein [Streptomyces sp. NPDC048349]|uniref:STAS domain-containing protein n=1 Tax=Streptomyces sp. NPDC048349 TaxID=3155486 RepID=UPI003415BEA0
MTQTMECDRQAGVPDVQISVTPGPCGSAEVTVSGEVDLHTAGHLREALVAALTIYRGAIAVDLHGVGFCDCAGLNALLAARSIADQTRRPLRVTTASRPVGRLLDVTGTRPTLM